MGLFFVPRAADPLVAVVAIFAAGLASVRRDTAVSETRVGPEEERTLPKLEYQDRD